MILEEATKETYSYYSYALTGRSGRPVLAACDNCGRIRTTTKAGYRPLCKSCAQKEKTVLDETKSRLSASKMGAANPMFGRMGEKHPNYKPKIKCNCLTCTKEFEVDLNVVNRGEGKFCSLLCMYKDYEIRFKGDNNPNWRGGISFEPYCVKFNNAFKEYIRAKFGYKCFLCPTTQADNGRKLSVHHVNYNKDCGCDGDKTCNFVPLCASCHAKTNGNRDYWQKHIMKKLHCIIIGWNV